MQQAHSKAVGLALSGAQPGAQGQLSPLFWRKPVGVETASKLQTKDLTEHDQQFKSA
jgi:hypothetical protein